MRGCKKLLHKYLQLVANGSGEKRKINNKQRRILEMELCYDGALIMPDNYAVMSEEEMTYVEGGRRLPTW